MISIFNTTNMAHIMNVHGNFPYKIIIPVFKVYYMQRVIKEDNDGYSRIPHPHASP